MVNTATRINYRFYCACAVATAVLLGVILDTMLLHRNKHLQNEAQTQGQHKENTRVLKNAAELETFINEGDCEAAYNDGSRYAVVMFCPTLGKDSIRDSFWKTARAWNQVQIRFAVYDISRSRMSVSKYALTQSYTVKVFKCGLLLYDIPFSTPAYLSHFLSMVVFVVPARLSKLADLETLQELFGSVIVAVVPQEDKEFALQFNETARKVHTTTPDVGFAYIEALAPTPALAHLLSLNISSVTVLPGSKDVPRISLNVLQHRPSVQLLCNWIGVYSISFFDQITSGNYLHYSPTLQPIGILYLNLAAASNITEGAFDAVANFALSIRENTPFCPVIFGWVDSSRTTGFSHYLLRTGSQEHLPLAVFVLDDGITCHSTVEFSEEELGALFGPYCN
ncbi:hypothetical protein Pelo_9676 [Pelomyxa schiedti]|nr:hypothetical protein Pelo_9676 [Pelomyxa schiedti]